VKIVGMTDSRIPLAEVPIREACTADHTLW
jgi:hypothetical protein